MREVENGIEIMQVDQRLPPAAVKANTQNGPPSPEPPMPKVVTFFDRNEQVKIYYASVYRTEGASGMSLSTDDCGCLGRRYRAFMHFDRSCAQQRDSTCSSMLRSY